MKSISINEIATNLNTSRNTVSKVLNSRGYVSDALKRRIVTEAVEKGYKNISPELLEYYHSLGDTSRPENHTVAVIAASPETSPYWTQIIAGISAEMNATAHRLLYHFIPAGQEFFLPDFLQSGRTDGLILLNLRDPAAIRQIAELPLAKVYLDLPSENLRDSVRGDIILPEGEQSIYGIVTHFISQKGCQCPAFLGDIVRSRAVCDRYAGFRQALENYGIPLRPDLYLLHDMTDASLPKLLEDYLNALPALPDLFICENDLTAYTLHQLLLQKLPAQAAQITVTGYDDLPPFGVSSPYLTSVAINTAQLAKKLVQQLLWRIENPEMPYETIRLSTGILFRD